MKKILFALLAVAALSEAAEKKIPPAGVALSQKEQDIFKRIDGGDFSLLTTEEMNRYLITLGELKPGLRSAQFCLEEFDYKEQLAEDQKNQDIAVATRNERKTLDLGDHVSNFFGGGNDSKYRSNAAQVQVAIAIDERRRDKEEAAAEKRDCLKDAKQYRQTMMFYHKVINADSGGSQRLPNPHRPGGD